MDDLAPSSPERSECTSSNYAAPSGYSSDTDRVAELISHPEYWAESEALERDCPLLAVPLDETQRAQLLPLVRRAHRALGIRVHDFSLAVGNLIFRTNRQALACASEPLRALVAAATAANRDAPVLQLDDLTPAIATALLRWLQGEALKIPTTSNEIKELLAIASFAQRYKITSLLQDCDEALLGYINAQGEGWRAQALRHTPRYVRDRLPRCLGMPGGDHAVEALQLQRCAILFQDRDIALSYSRLNLPRSMRSVLALFALLTRDRNLPTVVGDDDVQWDWYEDRQTDSEAEARPPPQPLELLLQDEELIARRRQGDDDTTLQAEDVRYDAIINTLLTAIDRATDATDIELASLLPENPIRFFFYLVAHHHSIKNPAVIPLVLKHLCREFCSGYLSHEDAQWIWKIARHNSEWMATLEQDTVEITTASDWEQTPVHELFPTATLTHAIQAQDQTNRYSEDELTRVVDSLINDATEPSWKDLSHAQHLQIFAELIRRISVNNDVTINAVLITCYQHLLPKLKSSELGAIAKLAQNVPSPASICADGSRWIRVNECQSHTVSRFVLMLRSQMLYSALLPSQLYAEQTLGQLSLYGVRSKDFLRAVECMTYARVKGIEEFSADEIEEFFRVLDYFLCNENIELVESTFMAQINTQTVVRILEIGLRFSLPNLCKACICTIEKATGATLPQTSEETYTATIPKDIENQALLTSAFRTLGERLTCVKLQDWSRVDRPDTPPNLVLAPGRLRPLHHIGLDVLKWPYVSFPSHTNAIVLTSVAVGILDNVYDGFFKHTPHYPFAFAVQQLSAPYPMTLLPEIPFPNLGVIYLVTIAGIFVSLLPTLFRSLNVQLPRLREEPPIPEQLIVIPRQIDQIEDIEAPTDAVEMLEQLSRHLTELDLSETSGALSDLHIQWVTQRCPNLEVLHLPEACLCGFHGWKLLSRLKNLRQLHVQLGQWSAHSLSFLNLKELLPHCNFSSVHVTCLEKANYDLSFLSNCPQLPEVVVSCRAHRESRHAISSAITKLVSACPNVTDLRVLDSQLHRTLDSLGLRLTDLGLGAVCSQLKHLRGFHLRLESSQDIYAIGQELPLIETLALTGNFRNQTPQHITHLLQHCQRLKELHITGRLPIDDSVLEACAQHPALECLNLIYNGWGPQLNGYQITDTGIQHLLNPSAPLKKVSIVGCPLVTSQMMRRLFRRYMFPQLHKAKEACEKACQSALSMEQGSSPRDRDLARRFLWSILLQNELGLQTPPLELARILGNFGIPMPHVVLGVQATIRGHFHVGEVSPIFTITPALIRLSNLLRHQKNSLRRPDHLIESIAGDIFSSHGLTLVMVASCLSIITLIRDSQGAFRDSYDRHIKRHLPHIDLLQVEAFADECVDIVQPNVSGENAVEGTFISSTINPTREPLTNLGAERGIIVVDYLQRINAKCDELELTGQDRVAFLIAVLLRQRLALALTGVLEFENLIETWQQEGADVDAEAL